MKFLRAFVHSYRQEIHGCNVQERKKQLYMLNLVRDFIKCIIDGCSFSQQDLEKKYELRTGLPSPERVDSRIVARRRNKKAVGFGKS